MAKKHYLNMRSTVRTLSIKIYDEQLPEGWEATKSKIVVIEKGCWQVIAICHDRDYAGDEFWLPALEKRHYHIIVRVLNGKNARVEQILRELGVVYRPEDKTLWENHGVETCRDFAGMTMYLPHWSEQAELDGKTRYEIEELVSNLTDDEIREVMKGYVRVGESLGKVTEKELAKLEADVFELGRECGDFTEWYKALPHNIKKNTSMRVYREMYELGLDEGIKELKVIPRLSVFVQGDFNKGKTKAAEKSCDKMGLNHLDIEAGGTGKFDNLTVSTNAIIVDDETLPHPLAMADTKVCRVYKRHRNNPPWIGKLLIVTSNLSFGEWIEKCGIKDEQEKNAARSRFYICHIEEVDGNNELICDTCANRGSVELQTEIYETYKVFRDYYNESLSEYHPDSTFVDRSDINSEAYRQKQCKEIPPEEANRRDLAEAEKEYEIITDREQRAYKNYAKDNGTWNHLWEKRLSVRRHVALAKWRLQNNYPPDRFENSNEERNEVKKYLPNL